MKEFGIYICICHFFFVPLCTDLCIYMNIFIRAINKIVKKIRLWWYSSQSTLVPDGRAKYVQPVFWGGKGKVIIGEGNTFGFFPSSNYYNGYCHVEARHVDAWIKIGNNNHFNNNFSIVAEHDGISIGNDCLIGTNVSIINSDFHPISAAKRHGGGQKSKFVEIGNNVFIGNNVSICKGVHIGDNAVIANGSVVFDDVKANTIVRGNPATFYKEIYE